MASEPVRARAASIDGYGTLLRDVKPHNDEADSSPSCSVQNTLKTSGVTIDRYMEDFQKHEIVACGYNVTSAKRSPKDHIVAMKGKLEEIVLALAESEVKSEGSNAGNERRVGKAASLEGDMRC